MATNDGKLARRLPDGRITAHYDPAIVRQLQAGRATSPVGPNTRGSPVRSLSYAAPNRIY